MNYRTDFRMHQQVEVSPQDKLRLEYFIKQENLYYNALVEAFSSRVRTSPASLVNLSDREKHFMIEIASSGMSILGYAKNGHESRFPSNLNSYVDLVLANNKLTASDSKVTLYDLGSVQAKLIPAVRKVMFETFMNHYAQQAISTLRPVSTEGDVYKEPITLLTQMSTERKRHLQIPRKELVMKWDSNKKVTMLACPYVRNPITCEYNLEKNSNWDWIILHQDEVPDLNPSTPWVVDTYKTKNHYLLKYCESISNQRYRIFNQAKRRS